MNANSLPKVQVTIKSWLEQATRQLRGFPSARLDAELILAHTIRKTRTYLHAHTEDVLDDRQTDIADARLALRLDRVPVAYIIGHKEFYGRQFTVTPSTLIPRPESEDMITILTYDIPLQASLLQSHGIHLVDVGTGSGCLGITAKLELPDLQVTLLDISRHALTVAEKNARRLEADVTIERSHLLDDYPFSPMIIMANLPYVDPDWKRSPETDHEPAEALFSANQGLALIYELIDQAEARIDPMGWLLLEADKRQHAAITRYAKDHGFVKRQHRGLILAFTRSL